MPILSLLFFINPLVGITSWIWVALRNIDKTSWTAIRGLALFLSLYLGMINSTKELHGDFLAYNEYYRDALQMPFLEYLLLYAKEPVYYACSWLICNLTQSNWPVFVTFFTTVSYMAIFESAILVAQKTQCSKYHVITVLLFTSLFFQGFAMNGNMLRQSISQSFALLFLTYLYFNQHHKWIIAILSIGIHTASIPIIGLGIIPIVKKKFTLKTFALLILTVIVLSVLLLSMSGILANILFIGYIFSRLENTSQLTGTDSWQTEIGINAQFYILSALLMAMIGYIYYFMHRYSKAGNTIPIGITGIVNIMLIILLFVFACNFSEAYFLCMRYQFYVYTFQPILILLFLRYFHFRYIHIVEACLCALMLPYFCYYFSYGVFKYASLAEILITTPILFFIEI